MNGLFVLAIEVMQDAELVQHERLVRANFLRLANVLQREMEVVGAQIFHPDAQPWNVRAGEEARGGAVRGHRLVRLVLRRKSMPKAHPRGSESMVNGR